MRCRHLLAPVLISVLLAGPAESAEKNTSKRKTALTARLVLKVVHPTRVRKSALQQVKDDGGFATLITDDRLRLKVPPEKLAGILKWLAEQGLVIEKTMERKDLTQEIRQLEGRLRSKREILVRLRKLLDDSNVQATLQIERTMTQLVKELEQVKGRLRVERDRARWAVVDLSFRFQKRGRIVYVQSPFAWLNSIDLQRFLREF